MIFESKVSFEKYLQKKRTQSRYAGRNCCLILDVKELIQDVLITLNRIADKNGNSITNLAESWMAKRSKVDGGKVKNRCGRGSWHTRCFGGAFENNLGAIWSPVTFLTVTGTKLALIVFSPRIGRAKIISAQIIPIKR